MHGGGFYNMRKYLIAPPELPRELTWFKWESYSTWISGFFLIAWIYYLQADLYTIDPEVAALAPWQAAAIGIGALAVGWLVYDGLCRSPLGRSDALLGAALFVTILAAAFFFTRVFNGRAAFLHTGAMIATWMSASVFLVIIPNQRKVVASLIAGGTPDPALGKQAKQRSTAQQLPHPAGDLPDALQPLPAGLVVVLRRSRSSGSWWWRGPSSGTSSTRAMPSAPPLVDLGRGGRLPCRRVGAVDPRPARPRRRGRAGFGGGARRPDRGGPARHPVALLDVPCGRARLGRDRAAPKGVRLDTPAAIARNAEAIRLQAVLTRAMPPNNITGMTAEERRDVAAWLSRRDGALR